MFQEDDIDVQRRVDGSIDIEFYARRAARLRHIAMKEISAYGISCLRRAIAKLANMLNLGTRRLTSGRR